MCISVISTAHPDYPFILISNRDEFIFRPTAPADWWDGPNEHVLGGRDLEKKERGTWLGITKQGRLACLTNFREPDAEKVQSKSRGGIINAYLTSPPHRRETSERFAHRLIEEVGVTDCGGFSLMFGELRPASSNGLFPGLSILSNRSASAEDLTHIATAAGETHGLSNSHFGDLSWPKVVHGEKLLHQAITANTKRHGDRAHLVESLFDILSVNMMPERKDGEDWDTYVLSMRNSILIPPTEGPTVENKPSDEVAAATLKDTARRESAVRTVQASRGSYGTQKQSVILVGKDGKALFVERTLHDGDGRRCEAGEGEASYEFEIEGWNERSRI